MRVVPISNNPAFDNWNVEPTSNWARFSNWISPLFFVVLHGCLQFLQIKDVFAWTRTRSLLLNTSLGCFFGCCTHFLFLLLAHNILYIHHNWHCFSTIYRFTNCFRLMQSYGLVWLGLMVRFVGNGNIFVLWILRVTLGLLKVGIPDWCPWIFTNWGSFCGNRRLFHRILNGSHNRVDRGSLHYLEFVHRRTSVVLVATRFHNHRFWSIVQLCSDPFQLFLRALLITAPHFSLLSFELLARLRWTTIYQFETFGGARIRIVVCQDCGGDSRCPRLVIFAKNSTLTRICLRYEPRIFIFSLFHDIFCFQLSLLSHMKPFWGQIYWRWQTSLISESTRNSAAIWSVGWGGLAENLNCIIFIFFGVPRKAFRGGSRSSIHIILGLHSWPLFKIDILRLALTCGETGG